MGIHTTFDQVIADEICDRIADGEPLRVICRDSHMPAWRTVYGWRQANEQFAARIARARLMGADAIAEDALLIADTPEIGERVEIGGEKGPKVIQEDMLGHRRLQIETRLKLLAKWFPKQYGEKLDVTSDGKQLGLSAEERQAKLAALAELARRRKVTQDEAPDDASDLV